MSKNLNYSKFILELLKYLWLFFNISLALIYILALINKIFRSDFKLLSTTNFIVIGLILLVSIGLNYLWLFKKEKSPSN